MDQRNKKESLEINPHTYSQLTFDKGGKNNGKKTVSLASGGEKAGRPHVPQCS